MGTVPIVTPGVDITGYIEPLLDGLHVICVSSPEDALTKIAAITEDKWTTMSKEAKAWWQRNASAEGSWQRTVEYK
jgi:ornithine carbamoyltransferase